LSESGADVDAPPLAVLVYDDGIAADAVLADAAAVLARAGVRLAGVVQSNIDQPGKRKCAMRLTDLTSGETIAISQDLGEFSDGCRLNPEALALASLGVERALAAGADLVIVNKFGKQEAQGRGLRGVIAEALASDTPVVLGVSTLNLHACLDFAGGAAQRLAADPQAIAAWGLAAIRRPA